MEAGDFRGQRGGKSPREVCDLTLTVIACRLGKYVDLSVQVARDSGYTSPTGKDVIWQITAKGPLVPVILGV